ncbi:MAG: glnD [Frankiales bacterium]|nr:glnD [Frankiales bacterium]
MPTPSEPSIRSARAELLARADLIGSPLRLALTELYDGWLTEVLPDVGGVALMAVGGLGRREPTPYSDLDLVLLHTGKVSDIAAVADKIWYPVWDAGIGLDHSVRTVDQALDVADGDLKATLGMLDSRHIAGDPALTGLLREQAISRWRRTAPSRLAELQELARGRWATRGDASFLLEPDLKDCRGGLRDWVGLRALASAQLLDLTAPVVQASTTLLDVRSELHRLVGRSTDVLRGQDRSAVAKALGAHDGDAVLRMVNEAARTLGYATDAAWRRVVGSNPSETRSRFRRRRSSGGPELPLRTPLAQDVVAQGGEVVLARDADPWADPALVLRVARAAAESDLPISGYALARLATESSPMPEPWPAAARGEFVALLGSGRRAVASLEALDQHGLLSRLIPEWEHVRFRAQHNPVHRFTVDRHLVETAVAVEQSARDVARPDLLLIGALLHDIGKGREGDHSAVGAVLARAIAARMGFDRHDCDLISGMAAHHLLLPDTATRRDLDDPSTVALVVSAISGSRDLLDLLYPLSVADAAATGPAAWSDWKGSLVASLVRRCRAAIGGDELPRAEPLDAQLHQLVARTAPGESRVVQLGSDMIVLAPDAPGLLSRAAGLLALHSLDVQSADVRTIDGLAVNRFTVTPRFGEFPDEALLTADLRRTDAGGLRIADRLRAKEAAYRQAGPDDRQDDSASTRLLWFDDEATDATVLEVRTRDAIGLLYWVTAALEESGVDIRSARISSLGAHVVDAFYLTDTNGKPLSEERQADVTSRMTAALAS